MSAPDWVQVNDVFHRALDVPAEGRNAFLDQSCVGQPALRAEVASLLEAHNRASAFIESPTATMKELAFDEGTGAGRPDPLLEVNQQIGQYRVLKTLGRGGMGVVYLAEDMRLGRTVALKAVTPKFAGDASRRERLKREARTAASLNHPGIATVYALEEFGADLYLVSEYVPGDTLRAELDRGPLSAARALETAAGLARTLASAHDRGIVHRDLKPENVIRTTTGELKILDFGLALLHDTAHPLESLTEDGGVLGTPAYMSPEQARGRDVDFRSDQFSLGVMLYELVSGVHPFAGKSTASTIINILEAEPVRLMDHRPAALAGPGVDWVEQIARVCLRKDPADRYGSTHALVKVLDRALTGVSTNQAAPADLSRISDSGSRSPALRTPRWWWQFHQVVTSVGYGVLLLPLWYARTWTTGSSGRVLFSAALVSVVAASTMRMHLWFTLQNDPSEWAEQHRRSSVWIRLADLVLVIVLLAMFWVGQDAHADFGLVFVAASVAVLIASLVIEPATTRAAFK